MERSKVVDVLKKVEPGLAVKDLIPVFSCFCFSQGTVLAYNDVVALEHPLDSPIRGAVRGKVILDWLAASRAKDLKVEQEDSTVTIRAGRAKLDIPALPEADFLFKWPKQKGFSEIDLDSAFLEGLRKAMISMGTDPTHPWRLGVTVAFWGEGKKCGVLFYSSDNKSATRVNVPLKEDGPSDLVVILPPRLCELLVTLGRTDSPRKLLVTSKWVECQFKSGLRLFSKTMSNADVSTFETIFGGAKGKAKSRLISLPKGLDRCLERAQVVLPFAAEPFSRVVIDGGKLVISTRSSAGDVRDALNIEDHEDCDVMLSPELVRRALPHAEKFCALPTDSCLMFTSKGYEHLVTLVEGTSSKEE